MAKRPLRKKVSQAVMPDTTSAMHDIAGVSQVGMGGSCVDYLSSYTALLDHYTAVQLCSSRLHRHFSSIRED